MFFTCKEKELQVNVWSCSHGLVKSVKWQGYASGEGLSMDYSYGNSCHDSRTWHQCFFQRCSLTSIRMEKRDSSLKQSQVYFQIRKNIFYTCLPQLLMVKGLAHASRLVIGFLWADGAWLKNLANASWYGRSTTSNYHLKIHFPKITVLGLQKRKIV